MPTRLTPVELERLVDVMLGEPDERGELDSLRVAATAKALSEAGINARMVSVNVVLDPEKWERPHVLTALRLRGTLFAGGGRRGWKPLIDDLRRAEKIPGDYCDQGRTYNIDWDGWMAMLQNNSGANSAATEKTIDGLHQTLERCRALVEQSLLDKRTQAVPAQRKIVGGPRL